MVQLWQFDNASDNYEIRRAGNSLRLYRNDIFHSQYNGGRLANGGVWDMLWLPIFFSEVEKIERMLLLGVGMGAALLKLHRLLPQVQFTAVDIDPVHLFIARQLIDNPDHDALFKQLADTNFSEHQLRKQTVYSQDGRVSFVCADAIEWVRRNNKRQYSAIIDDLFIDERSPSGVAEPRRVIALESEPPPSKRLKRSASNTSSWLSMLQATLEPGGLLIANCGGHREVKPALALWPGLVSGSAQESSFDQHQHFFACSLSTAHYANRVLCLDNTASSRSSSTLFLSESYQQASFDLAKHSRRKQQLASNLGAWLSKNGEVRIKTSELNRLVASVRMRRY